MSDLGAPTGVVDRVEPTVEHGLVAELELVIAGRSVLLVAGEVEEAPDHRLVLRRCDESVLLFTDPDAAEGLAWVPPRARRH